jgi:prepilin-type N-terminal cleavage/methylation domain-containing protein
MDRKDFDTMKAPTTRTRRAGFTLIELLMVIFLIGILATILGFAANRALRAARQTRVQTEIEQLSNAVETFKNDRGAYPPTWGTFIVEAPQPQQKKQRIQRFIAKAFPRYTGNYDQMRAQISLSTKVLVPAVNAVTSGAITLTASSTGNASTDGGLDINNLDPAETLVFWFGGIPNAMAENKLAGFRSDVTSPFLDPQYPSIDPTNPATLTGRSTSAFPFQPSRLVDRDHDGWWEYLPANSQDKDLGPPLVYFDNLVYGLGVFYPQTGPSSFTSSIPADQVALATNATTWGAVGPYANEGLPTGKPVLTWQKSLAFQIIAPGLDNLFNPDMNQGNMTTTAPFFAKLEFFPSGMNFVEQDRDNLTNFYQGPLGDAFE